MFKLSNHPIAISIIAANTCFPPRIRLGFPHKSPSDLDLLSGDTGVRHRLLAIKALYITLVVSEFDVRRCQL